MADKVRLSGTFRGSSDFFIVRPLRSESASNTLQYTVQKAGPDMRYGLLAISLRYCPQCRRNTHISDLYVSSADTSILLFFGYDKSVPGGKFYS